MKSLVNQEMDSRLRGNDTQVSCHHAVIPAKAGIHARDQQETSKELNSSASRGEGNAVDLRSGVKKIPPAPLYKKGEKRMSPPFVKGGLGGISADLQCSPGLKSTALILSGEETLTGILLVSDILNKHY